MSSPLRKSVCTQADVELWPAIDVSVLAPNAREKAEQKIAAIKMYVAGNTLAMIKERTGVERRELNRTLHRCLTVAADGAPLGFRALLPYLRIQPYTRTAPVKCVNGSNGAGCSGALGQLFSRLPELQQYLEDEFLRVAPTSKVQDIRIRAIDLHDKFIGYLRDRGVADNEWPFNTANLGEETIRRFCRSLLFTPTSDRWVAARCGVNAARRLRIGSGIHKAFSTKRPYGAVQLDFHKIDSACVILVENSLGLDIPVQVARWHIGLLVEERFELILGCVVALEITPSSDSVLETIECALEPIQARETGSAVAIGMGANVFPNQIFASLRRQSFSVIRMDNGWSNTAFDVIDNLIDVVGCAVNFGPVRQWWTRDQIERMIGQATRASLQRSPATFGSSPMDSRRNDPVGTAQRLQIKISDIVSALEGAIIRQNCTRTEALQMASPLAALEAAMDDPCSSFVPAPLPVGPQGRSNVLYKTIYATVRGNEKKGERPYVNVGRWRYTNSVLAASWKLLGEELKLYCSVRDARDVQATVCATGEELGSLVPPRRWQDTKISFRERALFFRAGGTQRRRERSAFPNDWLEEPLAAYSDCEVESISARDAMAQAKREIGNRADEGESDDAEQGGEREWLSTAQADARTFDLDRVIELNRTNEED